MAGNVQEKQLRWYNIALMSFITVWGFGNVVNNYANQGLVVVFSWVFIFALYFTPYALIVGQLGSTFKDGKGGVSTWIKHTMGPGLAYLAAWTYWVVHIPYLAQKPQAILIALGWAMKGDGFANQRIFSRSVTGVNAGAVYLLYVGCFTRYEIAENRRFCGRDCYVCYVAPVCGDGGNRACNY